MTLVLIMAALVPQRLDADQNAPNAAYPTAAPEILVTTDTSDDRGEHVSTPELFVAASGLAHLGFLDTEMTRNAGRGTPITQEKTNLKWLILGMVAAQAADIVTTSLALHRGCVETTYYGLQNKWAIGGMKAAGTAALTVTLPMFHNSKPKLSKTLAWAQIASGVLGGALNATRLPHCR